MEIHTEIDIDAPAGEAWRVLGDQFGEVDRWTTALTASSLDGPLRVGATRICQLGPDKQVAERLTAFDPEAMAFAYIATSGLPSWLRGADDRWSVEPLGSNRCRVRVRPSLDLVWWARPFGPLMGLGIKRMLGRVCEELKYRVERGRPHPRKLAQLAALLR